MSIFTKEDWLPVKCPCCGEVAFYWTNERVGLELFEKVKRDGSLTHWDLGLPYIQCGSCYETEPILKHMQPRRLSYTCPDCGGKINVDITGTTLKVELKK